MKTAIFEYGKQSLSEWIKKIAIVRIMKNINQ